MEKDNLELYEDREYEILEELGRMEMNDPKRKDLVNELTAISSIRVSYEQNEQNRLNNNAKNDIEEAKLVLEAEKVRSDKEKNWMFLVQAVASFSLGYHSIMRSFHMEEKNYGYKKLQDFGTNLVNKVRGR